jgi:hypothetical protein
MYFFKHVKSIDFYGLYLCIYNVADL